MLKMFFHVFGLVFKCEIFSVKTVTVESDGNIPVPESSWQDSSSRICAISSFSQSVDRLVPLLHFTTLLLVLYLSLHHSAHIFGSLTPFHFASVGGLLCSILVPIGDEHSVS